MMLFCTANKRKLPAYIAFKRKTFQVSDVFPKKIFMCPYKNGWMSSAMVQEWAKTVWQRRPRAWSFKESLLVLDSYRRHLTDAAKAMLSEGRTDLAIIPGGMTNQPQPLDLSMNKTFKDGLRMNCIDWLSLKGHQLTPTGSIKRAFA